MLFQLHLFSNRKWTRQLKTTWCQTGTDGSLWWWDDSMTPFHQGCLVEPVSKPVRRSNTGAAPPPARGQGDAGRATPSCMWFFPIDVTEQRCVLRLHSDWSTGFSHGPSVSLTRVRSLSSWEKKAETLPEPETKTETQEPPGASPRLQQHLVEVDRKPRPPAAGGHSPPEIIHI